MKFRIIAFLVILALMIAIIVRNYNNEIMPIPDKKENYIILERIEEIDNPTINPKLYNLMFTVKNDTLYCRLHYPNLNVVEFADAPHEVSLPSLRGGISTNFGIGDLRENSDASPEDLLFFPLGTKIELKHGDRIELFKMITAAGAEHKAVIVASKNKAEIEK